VDDLTSAIEHLDLFSPPELLTRRVGELEAAISGMYAKELPSFMTAEAITPTLLGAATTVKHAAGQINVLIHALGILLCLPHLLERDEKVLSLSLGAGNTGRAHDLSTDRRVAEFKFINWRGGAEAIRQNSVFIDRLSLVQDNKGRRRFLYLLNKGIAMRFLHGNRAISSVLSRSQTALTLFQDVYAQRYERVHEWYFNEVRDQVEIVDLGEAIPTLAHSLAIGPGGESDS
jgi:hypothetical protein